MQRDERKITRAKYEALERDYNEADAEVQELKAELAGQRDRFDKREYAAWKDMETRALKAEAAVKRLRAKLRSRSHER